VLLPTRPSLPRAVAAAAAAVPDAAQQDVALRRTARPR
jgi:hypothetical protein